MTDEDVKQVFETDSGREVTYVDSTEEDEEEFVRVELTDKEGIELYNAAEYIDNMRLDDEIEAEYITPNAVLRLKGGLHIPGSSSMLFWTGDDALLAMAALSEYEPPGLEPDEADITDHLQTVILVAADTAPMDLPKKELVELTDTVSSH